MATKKRKVDQEDDLLSAPNHDIDTQCLDSSAVTAAGGPVAPPPDAVEDDEDDEEEEDVGKLLEPHLRRSPLPHLLPCSTPSLTALAIFPKPSSLSSPTLVSPSLMVRSITTPAAGGTAVSRDLSAALSSSSSTPTTSPMLAVVFLTGRAARPTLPPRAGLPLRVRHRWPLLPSGSPRRRLAVPVSSPPPPPSISPAISAARRPAAAIFSLPPPPGGSPPLFWHGEEEENSKLRRKEEEEEEGKKKKRK